MKSKNLIVIIGNGFDLAHKFKTAYNDFANYIIEKEIAPRITNSREPIKNDSFLNKKFLYELNRNGYGDNYGNLIQRLTYYQSRGETLEISELIKQNSSEIKNIITNSFLGKLYNNEYKNWFDIENAYFEELIFIKEKTIRTITEEEEVKKINNNLTEIKGLLYKYLKTIKTTSDSRISIFFKNHFFNKRENLYIINFNYTITVENYLFENDSTPKTRINYIHGDIENSEIIFGYGNDKHNKYLGLKNSNKDEYLRFFKTYEYLNSRNYSKIYEEALEHFEDYEVSILGHSLGETDKTLLKEVLDNPKCKKIHLYKRKDLCNSPTETAEEFNKLIYATSRIIENEKDLRIKVMNSKDSSFFPA